MASLCRHFLPSVREILFGSSEQTSLGWAINSDRAQAGLGNASEYRIGNRLDYDAIENVEISVEADYAHIDQTITHDPG